MATRSEIIADALRNLRVLGAGVSPDAEDDKLVGVKLDRVYARLRGKGMTNDGAGVWSLSAVPDEFVDPLVIMTSSASADTFSVKEDRLVRLRLEAVEAENEIRRQSAKYVTGPAKVEQF